MGDYPMSESLHEAVERLVLKAVKDNITWDFVDGLIDPIMVYLQSLAKDCKISIWTRPEGAALNFSLSDEGGDTTHIDTGYVDLVDVVEGMWPECPRSELDVILALEHSLQRIKSRFQERHGIPCTVEAVSEWTAERWPNVSYTPWPAE